MRDDDGGGGGCVCLLVGPCCGSVDGERELYKCCCCRCAFVCEKGR